MTILRWCLSLCAVVVLFGCSHGKLKIEKEAFLIHGKLIDPDERRVFDGNIVILDGKVESVTEGMVPGAFIGEVYDLGDSYILPAFADSYVDLSRSVPSDAAKLFLQSGVTSVLDLGSSNSEVLKARDEQRKSGLSASADLFTSGPAWTYGNESPAEIREKMKTFIETENPDLIRFNLRGKDAMAESQFREAMKIAHQYYKKVMVEIDRWDEAKLALSLGADVIAGLGRDSELKFPLIRLAKKKKALWFPLLITPTTNRALDRQSFQLLQEFNIPLLAGTKVGSVGVGSAFGPSIHREMQLWVENGSTHWAALKAATTQGHVFVGKRVCFSIDCAADFVILKKNPVEDIRNTLTVEGVVFRGQWAIPYSGVGSKED